MFYVYTEFNIWVNDVITTPNTCLNEPYLNDLIQMHS